MNNNLRRIRLTPFFITAIFLLMTGILLGGSEDNITKSFNVKSGGKLYLDTDIGSIEVEAKETRTLKVKVYRELKTLGSKRAKEMLDDLKFDFDQQGNDVHVTAIYKRSGFQKIWDNIGKHLRVKFVVTVPKVYDVVLKTSGGSISINGLEGEVNSRTSGGSLHFDNIKGNIEGKTSGGSIRIGEVDGSVYARTSGGSIKIIKAKGKVDVHTSGGGINIEEVMGTIKASTSGGSIKAYISRQPKSDCRLTTSGGSVTVYLAEDINVDLDAHTSGGRVSTDFPVTVRGEISKRTLRAKINDGGPELYLRSSGGSIRLKKAD